MAKAIWNQTIIAESDKVVEVEGNLYFPVSSVRPEYLRENTKKTSCPWKGIASYYDLHVDGNINQAAAWYYCDPKPAASEILNHVAFWRGVQIER